jgi:uncharacterized membrane protein
VTQVDQTQARGAMDRMGRLELAISRLLRWCMFASLLLVLLGLLAAFAHHPDYARSPDELRRLTADDAPFPYRFGDAVVAAAHFRSGGLILLGIFLLFATPILSLLTALGAFVLWRDWAFVAITMIVLAVLAVSFSIGRAGG